MLLNKFSSANEIRISQWNDPKGEYESVSIESILNPEPVKNWRTYISRLTSVEKEKLLTVLLERFIDEYRGSGEIRYSPGVTPEFEDEKPFPECIYWESCGEPLI